MSDKPLNVRVAEALGCKPTVVGSWSPDGKLWGCTCTPEEGVYPHAPPWGEGNRIIRDYDRDWSATGPLIEALGISVEPFIHGGWRSARPSVDPDEHIERRARTPLLAICNLIVELHEAGKLKELLDA